MLRAASGGTGEGARRPLALSLLKLARPHQWSKGAFVVLGPFYGLADLALPLSAVLWQTFLVLAAFSLASSGCYVFNDLTDAPLDRMHPRKRRRPIASGEVSPRLAIGFGLGLLLGGLGVAAALPAGNRWWVMAVVALYIFNVQAYSAVFKRIVILDVMSLSAGFVLRVIGGCAAVGIAPTTWLLNVTFFLSMFLSFGKRLGERRTMAASGGAAAARSVQSVYTDDLLRMAVVVTGVATLLTYAGYIQERAAWFGLLLVGPNAWTPAPPGSGAGFNLLWLTVLPATYCLLRCIVLLEHGDYDDPTELAARDRPFQVGAALFGLLTVGLLWWFRMGGAGLDAG